MSFKDKKIAVVGVSENPLKYGYKIFKDLSKSGYEVYGVNPKLKSLDGKNIYPNISSIPLKPEIVILVVPPEISIKIVDECIGLKIEQIWFQPGSESEEAVKKAEQKGIKTTVACFMVQNRIW
ncbi:MAG: CoA-binding protein [Elusimicrobiales bacterium]|nr:CoA-binding protein [Elusimicrobiales bacterium]